MNLFMTFAMRIRVEKLPLGVCSSLISCGVCGKVEDLGNGYAMEGIGSSKEERNFFKKVWCSLFVDTI